MAGRGVEKGHNGTHTARTGFRHAPIRVVGAMPLHASGVDLEDAHGLAHVLELMFAKVDRGDITLVADVVVHDLGDDDRARSGLRLNAGREVDAVSEHVATRVHDLAKMDPDPHLKGTELTHPPLDLLGTAHRLRHRREAGEDAVAEL